MKSQEIFCGKNVLAILDIVGKVFLFNENDGLIKLKIENRIKTIKFNDNNFYAMTADNKILYEFTQKKILDFNLDNYFEYKYFIEDEFVSKIQLLEMPYFVNLLFFMGEFQNNLNYNNIKKKIFKGEKNLSRDLSKDYSNMKEKDMDSAYESVLTGNQIMMN